LELIASSQQDGVDALVYLSTAWECPYEGAVAPAAVLELAAQAFAAGATEVIIADTIGAADPAAVKKLLQPLVAEFGAARLTCHFHDTRGMALANVYAALESGIRKFDASIGGLGGCPFAPGATGNVATEDVALLLAQTGCATGIDLNRLVAAAELAAELTGNSPGGHSLRWLRQQRGKGLL
jgi:hydroxymethylglutaryl-CoA lyase